MGAGKRDSILLDLILRPKTCKSTQAVIQKRAPVVPVVAAVIADMPNRIAFLFQGLYSWTSSAGKADGFDLHFGHFLLVIVVGTVLAIWWGWRSTAIVLLVDGAWQSLAGLADRRILAGLPPGDNEVDDGAPTETEGSTEL